MEQVEMLVSCIGILNLECAVLPPIKSNEAMPLEATAKTISPSERSDAIICSSTKDLPVPPGPSKKKKLLSVAITHSVDDFVIDILLISVHVRASHCYLL